MFSGTFCILAPHQSQHAFIARGFRIYAGRAKNDSENCVSVCTPRERIEFQNADESIATAVDDRVAPNKITALNSTDGATDLKATEGDKVRLKTGEHRGERGIIKRVEEGRFVVCLEKSGKTTRVMSDDVTNYSLAARKAWVTDPNRGVGRRKGTRLCDRVSVTLRLDRNLWEQFQGMEESGDIEDRTSVINEWFREKLDLLDEAKNG